MTEQEKIEKITNKITEYTSPTDRDWETDR